MSKNSLLTDASAAVDVAQRIGRTLPGCLANGTTAAPLLVWIAAVAGMTLTDEAADGVDARGADGARSVRVGGQF